MDIETNLENTKEINALKIVDVVLNIGLKSILPDFLENDIIEIKDAFIKEGFVDGVKEILDKLEDMGKSIIGIFSGRFETVEQIKRLVQTDGILDGISELIDKILKKLMNKGKIDKNIYNLIKTGKKEILNIVEDNLKSTYQETTYSLEKLNKYCEEWKENYKNKNYDEMKKSSNKIKQRLEQSEMVEDIINEARNIEKMQKYIEKKGSIENLSEKEKQLLEKIK